MARRVIRWPVQGGDPGADGGSHVATTIHGGAPSDTSRVFASGARIGRYEVLAVLGTGTLTTVYRALDPQLSREVALVVLEPARLDAAGTEQQRALLLAQTRALA